MADAQAEKASPLSGLPVSRRHSNTFAEVVLRASCFPSRASKLTTVANNRHNPAQHGGG